MDTLVAVVDRVAVHNIHTVDGILFSGSNRCHMVAGDTVFVDTVVVDTVVEDTVVVDTVVVDTVVVDTVDTVGIAVGRLGTVVAGREVVVPRNGWAGDRY